MDRDGRGDGLTSRFAAWLLPPLVLGAVLRGFGLQRQILISDELHAVNASLSWSLPEIVTRWTYHGADYCVPLTLLFRFLLDRGVVMSELGYRVPSMLAGLALIVLLPALLRKRIGDRAALACAWLVAISPMLVLYTRIVRSYAVALLLLTLAVACFERWRRSGGAGFAIGYVLCAALTVWFHIGMGPIVFAPFVFAVFVGWRRGTLRADLPRFLALAAPAVLLTALLLWPARDSILALTRTHRHGVAPSAATWLEVARTHAGTSSYLLFAAFAGLAARGGWLLWRRDAQLLGLVATLAGVHVAALYVLRPDQLETIWVLTRYLLVLVPMECALVALALSEIVRPDEKRWRRSLRTAALPALLLGLLATGPLVTRDYRYGSFTHSLPAIAFTTEGNWTAESALPDFYRSLDDGGRGDVIEYPWHNLASHAYEAYQRHHHHPVRVASQTVGPRDPRVVFRNIVDPHPDKFLDGSSRYLVVHLDLELEEALVSTSDRHHWKRLVKLRSMWASLRKAGTRMARVLEERWGPPDHASSGIRVWDLERVRRES